MKNTHTEKVVIIGGGPAGLSAAIYLARANLKPLVFAGSPPGGQLMLTSEVENFPGYVSILGSELIEKMRKQAIQCGAQIVDENIISLDVSKKPFKVYLSDTIHLLTRVNSSSDLLSESEVTSSNLTKSDNRQKLPDSNIHSQKKCIVSDAIVIATGAKAIWLGLESETRLRGKGVSACATCDGFFFRNKVVAVVGGGDTALEEALTLTKFAQKVYLIHRRDSFRASKIMQEHVRLNKKIEVIWNAQVEEILGSLRVEGVRLKSVGTGPSKLLTLKVDGIFIAIGHKPDTEMFSNSIELDEKGYVYTSQRVAYEYAKINGQDNQMSDLLKKFNLDYPSATSVSGVFATGDCTDVRYKQASTASGLGVATALDVEKWLEN